MKTERRHELQTNALADWLGKHVEQVRPYAKGILAIALIVVAAAIAGTYISRNQATQSRLGWNEFYRAFGQRSAEDLEEVAASHSGTEAAVWAKQAEADIQLAEGIRDLYINRDLAKKSLEKARQSYLFVKELASDGLLKDRALFGLAQVHESLAELDQARNFYAELASGAPNSALGAEAGRRLDALNEPATEKWYNWFANQTPRPPTSSGLPTGPGMPNLPLDLGSLPDRPDISLPEIVPPTPPKTEDVPANEPEGGETEGGGDESAAKKEPPAGKSADGDAEPATPDPTPPEDGESQPAETSPANETPASDDSEDDASSASSGDEDSN
jgi:hypothetical protein